MTKLNRTETRTLLSARRHGFTFKGDTFRTYRQAVVTLNKLERLGLLRREDHDPNMYVPTTTGRELSI